MQARTAGLFDASGKLSRIRHKNLRAVDGQIPSKGGTAAKSIGENLHAKTLLSRRLSRTPVSSAGLLILFGFTALMYVSYSLLLVIRLLKLVLYSRTERMSTPSRTLFFYQIF